jgi:YbgC/YbaW family acyl-CoA thioester hydrolase
MNESLVTGQCHCGNIAFALRWFGEPDTLVARSCSCTFCVARGASWTSVPSGQLEVSVQAVGLVSQYRFGTHSAVFHVCARCGGVPLSTSEIDGATYAVINVNTLADVERSQIATQPADLGDENLAARLARRKRNWIGEVRFVRPGFELESEPRPFRIQRSVLFGDCDPGGIIYTPRVAHYVVEAAMEFMTERLGTSSARLAFQTGILPPARVLHIEYLSPMTYDDQLEIEVAVEHIGARSYTLRVHAHKRDRTPTFYARLVQVCVSAQTMRAVPLPDELRARLER